MMEVIPSVPSMSVPEEVSLQKSAAVLVSDGTDVKGSERHHGNICGAEYSSVKQIPSTKVPILILALALHPQTVEEEH